jgi:multisubunit Na+/H+ antiporter MnhE subunit
MVRELDRAKIYLITYVFVFMQEMVGSSSSVYWIFARATNSSVFI